MEETLEHSEWQGKTDGLPWMHKLLVRVLSILPLWMVYIPLAVVVPFYMIFNFKGYKAQYHFFRQRLGKSSITAFFHVYANHFRFGQVIVDRFAAYGGHRFRFEVDGQELYDNLASGEEGFVQISSHTGSYELAGYSLKQQQKTLLALVFFGEAQIIMANRAKLFAPHGVEMVPVMPDMSHIFALNNALRDGHIVSMPGDRIFGSQKAVRCRFFDADADFPVGPFQMALTRGVPVISVFVMNQSLNHYHITVRRLEVDENSLKTTGIQRRQERLQQLAQRYASELETVVRQYPHQWFNYFEFWQ